MKQLRINKNYLLLKNWWESIDLTNYEKSFFNREIISFNQQLFRLKEKKIRIGTYGKSGVGKSSVLNSLLKKDIFKTDIINGTTREIQAEEWKFKDQTLNSVELIDSPGFDFCDIKFPDKVYSCINQSDLILFIISGDLDRNELKEISSFIEDGKKILLILNKINLLNKTVPIWTGSKMCQKKHLKSPQWLRDQKVKNIREVQSTFSGGIPVDRDYVVFIIDTSGSMKRYWSLVIQQIDVILELHPKIKGFQVMSDNGEYLLEGYAASWIPDTNLVRKRIVKKLGSWSPYSNSSPAEGLERALRFHTKKPVSIYVMGDDFTGASYDDILNKVKRMNPRQSNGEKIAKIHGIGFPWGLDERFPTLMRELAFQNDGVFLNAKIPIQNASL